METSRTTEPTTWNGREGMQCQSCYSSDLTRPLNNHPAYLECPNCGAIELLYEPQTYQEEIHTIPYNYSFNEKTGKWEKDIQIIGAFGGYGSGKSKSSLQEIILRALENPKGTGLLTAPTLQQLKRTTLKTLFNEVLPPPLVTRYNKQDGEIELINGFVFYIIPSDDEEKLRSINAGLCHMEEASGIKRSIYDQILTRMRDPYVHNRLFMVCSNPDLGWIRDVFVMNADRADPTHPKHSDFNRFISTYVWPTELNRFLPPDFIELNSKGKPEWWIKRYLKGSFEHSEGMVYPNFSSCLTTEAEYFAQHDLTEIPRHWYKFVNLDHGLRNPTAVYISAINPKTGEVVTYTEYYEPNRLVPEHAKHLKPMIDSIPSGKLQFMVADPSIKNKTDPVNGKSVLGLYAEYDLFFQPGNNSIEAGILRVNSYIERKKWVIFKDRCPNLAQEGVGYKFPELSMDELNENLDERPVKAHDHSLDSMRYGFMRLPEDPDMLLSLAHEPPKVYNKSSNPYSLDDDDEDYSNKDFLSYV